MVFPVGTDESQHHTTPVITYFLILVNVGVFLVEQSQGEAFVRHWAFTPREFFANPIGHLPTVLTLYGAFFVKGSNLAPMFFCSTGSGHLAGRRRSGLRDNQRGNPPSCAAHGRDTTLYSVAPYEAHHDAVIRILGEVPRRRPHSPCRRLKPW